MKQRLFASSPGALSATLAGQTVERLFVAREQLVFVFSNGFVVVSGQFDLNDPLLASEDDQVRFGLLTPEEKQAREDSRKLEAETHERAQLARLKAKYER